ncbi:MAG: amidohydrolase family protein [Rhodospirillaceae bacterium]|jgi:uncharacterized protein|nr:amidohydrolase family protein [Rhodospirillaceae bacterium]MBT6117793.1 amidohydrolase family protein [Rhodospirillaceae bacterium]
MIDGGVFLGRDPTIEVGLKRDALLTKLTAYGAGRALAASFRAVYYDTREGNDEMRDAAAESGGRLLPMAAVNLGGYDPHGVYLADLKDQGFVALGLFPAMQNWTWAGYAATKLAEQAADLGLPIQAAVHDAGEMQAAIRALAPAGTTVLIRWMKGTGYNNLPDMIAAAEDFPNLIFDVSTVTQAGGIEFLAARTGADRLYFASNMPLTLEGAPYFMVYGADLSPGDRLLLEGGTLARALKLPADDAPAEPHPRWDQFRDRPKIDNHWHTGTWNLIEPRLSFEAMSEDFDRYHFDLVCSSSIRALNYEIREGNAETLAHVEHDSRVRGLVVVNPYQIEATLAEIEKYKDDPRFVGLKTIQDYFQDHDYLSLDDPRYAPILEAAAALGWPVMAHPPGIAEVAPRYPSINFISAHSTWNFWRYAQHPNVYFDVATSTALRRQVDLERLLATVGEDRILYSSDAQLMSPAWTLGKLASVDLGEAAYDKLFTKNLYRAFPRLRGAGA